MSAAMSANLTEQISISNVHYAPDLKVNLLSVAALTAKGVRVHFDGRECTIRNAKRRVVARALQVTNRLYQLSFFKRKPKTPRGAANLAPLGALATAAPTVRKPESTATRELIDLFHRRLGHSSHDSVRTLFANHMGLDTDKLLGGRSILGSTSESPQPCDACHLGKSHRTPLPQHSITRKSAPLELVHMDVCGPFRVKSVGGARYWLLIVDDCTRKTYLRPMAEKSEAPALFMAYKANAELRFKRQGHFIKQVRIDGGGEFGSATFRHYLSEQGIAVQETSAYTSQQNGVVERKHRVVADHMRAMMLAWGPSHNMPTALWAEVATTAVYLLNRSPTRALSGMTPEEAWTGTKPSYSHLRTIGCVAYAHSHPATRNKVGGLGKLGPQASRCAMLGYSETAKAYRLWDFKALKVITSIHVTFEEQQPAFTTFSARMTNVTPLAAWEDILPSTLASDSEEDEKTGTDSDTRDTMPALVPPPAGLHPPQDAMPPLLPPQDAMPPLLPPPADLRAPALATARAPAPAAAPAPARPTFLQVVAAQLAKDRAAKQRPVAEQKADVPLDPAMALPATPALSTVPVTTEDPRTYEEAMKRADAPAWLEAMKVECRSHESLHTFTLTQLPDGFDVMGGKWVFRTKRGPDGTIIKYKARWVAQGFTQKYGIDYNETFAPVARFDSIRAILSLVAHHDWELHQMDVRTAYLHGELEEEIYMKQPTGFTKPGTEGMVCRLNKSLYGLRQAGRVWNKRIDVELKALGFAPIHADPCVYAYKRGSVMLIISLYVDDLLPGLRQSGRTHKGQGRIAGML
jgi:transposase InsO family protein